MSKREEAVWRVLQANELEHDVAQRLGIKSETLSSWIKQAKVVSLILEGSSQAEISRAYGIAPQTLSRWVKEAKAKQNKLRPEITDTNLRPAELRLASTVFGSLIAKLRRERGLAEGVVLSVDEFARRLGVSSGTLRNMESAQKAPPQTTIAYPLSVGCGLFLPMTFIVIGFVRAFDESDSIQIALELAREMRKAEPRLSFLVDHLDSALVLAGRERQTHLKKESVIDKLALLMRTQPVSVSPQNSAPAMLLGQVSPVLVDAIMALSEKLHLFHPALDEVALSSWEDVNSHRIRRVFSYYSNPRTLLDTIDAFRCKFLSISSAPIKYIIILNAPSTGEIDSIKEKILKKFPTLPESAIIVHGVDKNSEIALAFLDVLNYDVNGSRIADSNGHQTIKMTTINLYELDLINSHYGTSFGQMHCAFIDNTVFNVNKNRNPPASMYFARALQNFDIDRILPLFRGVSAKHGVEL